MFAAPASERAVFPEDHPQFAGGLPFAIPQLAARLEGHDLVLVLGAPVFRYYPYKPGEYLPTGCRLLHVTDDADEAARAPVGDSLIADAGLDLPAFDVVQLARGYGCQADRVATPNAVADRVRAALDHDGPTVIEVPISKAVPPLL